MCIRDSGLGVLGWGVGGIEAEAAMLGQPISMLLPQVVGFRLTGELPEGATATDLVLTVTEMLRERGVVGKFVEFFGPGLHTLGLADRATIGNMSPEFGSTCAIYPDDSETLRYLEFTGRPTDLIELGCPSIAASASMPPTPQPTTPSPFTMVVCESVPTSVSGYATVLPSTVSEKTTRARCSMFTWWTMPVSGGTTLKLWNACWPQRRNA